MLGEVRTEAWLAYLSIDWRAAGMDPAAYWQDICELAVWEPYAIGHGNEAAWFAAVRSDEVDLVEAILLDLETELRASVLDYHAHYAVDALASLYVASASHDRFVGLASRLGPYSWMRVDAMAKSAHSAGDTDLAVEVFRASLAAGGAEHLVSRCRELTGVELDAGALGRG